MSGLPAAAVRPAPALVRGLGIPAYFHPALAAAQWSRMVQYCGSLRTVILNVDSGPGAVVDQSLLAVARRTAEVTTVLGYVDTGYGSRCIAEVLAEIARYRAWYPVSGVFLDQVTTSARTLPWYRRLTATIRDLAAGEIVLNPGTVPLDPGYAEIADAVVTFEGPYPAYRRLRVPPWARELPPERFWHLVYATPADQLGPALETARSQHAATVYVTDGTGPNPWGGLPPYFAEQAAAWSRALAGPCPTATSEDGAGHD